jgi:predicted dinucleotide-binding enzyme
MQITFIGAGRVGAALAVRLAAADHTVTLAATAGGSASLTAALARSPRLTARPLLEAVAAAEIVVLAVPFGAVAEVVGPLATALAGKVLVDCTNPVGPGLTHGLASAESGSARLQALAPAAHVVKAFSIYGFENLEDPSYPDYDVAPAMLYCGDHAPAKAQVAELVRACGFEPLDVGGLVQALHLEHMTLLWVRMVRAGGAPPGLVWAALQRPRPRLPSA